MIRELLINDDKSSVEGNGYYENIPLRVGEYVLTKNKKDEIIFETTNSDICEGHGRLRLVIECPDDNWRVRKHERGCVQPIVSETDEINDENLERVRVLWHAKQYMLNKKLNNKERYSKIYRRESTDIFEDDAFFENGSPRTLNPFEEYFN